MEGAAPPTHSISFGSIWSVQLVEGLGTDRKFGRGPEGSAPAAVAWGGGPPGHGSQCTKCWAWKGGGGGRGAWFSLPCPLFLSSQSGGAKPSSLPPFSPPPYPPPAGADAHRRWLLSAQGAASHRLAAPRFRWRPIDPGVRRPRQQSLLLCSDALLGNLSEEQTLEN